MCEDQTTEAVEVTIEKPIVARWLWFLGAVILVTAIAINLEAYFSAGSAEQMGQWGDFVGGVFNPLLSFLAFAGLLYTILLQQRELGLSREELRLTRKELANSANALNDQNLSLKQQRFESAFFGMISVLNQIISTMDCEHRNSPLDKATHFQGRDCFVAFLKQLQKAYDDRSYNNEPIYHDQSENPFGHPKVIEYPHDDERIFQSYEYVYNIRKSDLAHYFRVLYNIFQYVEKSEFESGVYAKILRAQLSNQELVLLFYNCLSAAGKKFMHIATRFHLFDNLDVNQLIRPEHKHLMPVEAFGPSGP